MFNHFAIAGFLTFLGNLCIAAMIFLKNRKNLTNRIFALFFLSVSVYGFGFFRQAIAQSIFSETIAIKVLLFGTVFIPVFFIHGVYLVCEKQIKKSVLYTLYLVGTIFACLNFFTDLLARDPIAKFGLKYVFQAGPLYPILALFFGVCSFLALKELYQGHLAHKGLKKNQLTYLFWGTLVGFCGGSIGFMLGYKIDLYPLNPFSSYAVFLANIILGYAIIRYRLLNLNVVLTRASILSVVYILVLGIPFYIGSIGQALLIDRFGMYWWYIPMAFLAILATLGPFLYLYLQRHAENTLLSDERRYQKIIYSASKEMFHVKDLNRLLELIVHVLTKTVHITYAGIYLYDKEKTNFSLAAYRGEKVTLKAKEIGNDNPLIKCLLQTRKATLFEEIKYYHNFANIGENELRRATSYMRSMNATLIIPTFREGRLSTFLVLGDKISGRIYTEDDLSTLSVLANQAALAIENAQFIKQLEEMQAKLRETEKLVATGEMLGSVRHEMGNLINKASTGMQMMTDLFLQGSKDKYEELREKVVDNLISAKTIWKYVDDYKQKSESDEVNSYKLEEMINTAVGDSNELFKKWKINLSLEIDRRIILSGKASLPDIFKHLVINSCYGMEIQEPEKEKGGKLTITANAIPELNEVEIIQKDTGTDLTKDIKNHTAMGGELFGEQGKHGGISLFLARRITHDHKGTFEILSNKGKGTKFIIRLPLDSTKA